MGHALLKKAILLLKMANVQFDLLLAVYTQAKKDLNGKQNFDGFCLIVPKPLDSSYMTNHLG